MFQFKVFRPFNKIKISENIFNVLQIWIMSKTFERMWKILSSSDNDFICSSHALIYFRWRIPRESYSSFKFVVTYFRSLSSRMAGKMNFTWLPEDVDRLSAEHSSTLKSSAFDCEWPMSSFWWVATFKAVWLTIATIATDRFTFNP